MSRSRRFLAAALMVLLPFFAWIASAAVGAAEREVVTSPRDAREKANRDDLLQSLRERGRTRVIVGLQAPGEVEQRAGHAPDHEKAQTVSARQLRLLKRLEGRNVREIRRLRLHQFMVLSVDAGALNALLADPEVTSVAVDRPRYPVIYDTPGITRATGAWAAGIRGSGQVVAIIDSGVDPTHPLLSGKVLAEACFSNPVGTNTSYCPAGAAHSVAPGSGAPCADYSEGCWHGTHVAGVAAGRDGVLGGAAGGMAPDAGIIAIQVFQRSCATCPIEAYDSDILAALEHVYSLRNTFNIAAVNLSLAGDVLYAAPCDGTYPAFKSVIDNLRNANIATVVSAGNNGNANALPAPACLSNAISVGATTKQNAVAEFSNSASFLSLLAPGSTITSSAPAAFAASGLGMVSGTSAAAAHVAGAWALLKSAKASATVSEVLAALQNSGLPVTDKRSGVVKPLLQLGDSAAQLGALGALLAKKVPQNVVLTSPADGASFTAPASIRLTGEIAEMRGAASRMEFYSGTNKIHEMAGAPYDFVWTGVPAGAYTLTARAIDGAGDTVDSGPVNISVSPAAVPGQTGQRFTAAAADVVWVEDAVPAGATAGGAGESWSWVSANPEPFSGALAHQSGLVSGIHQHYFTSATAMLSVGTGEVLFTYVYLDPVNPPSEVMLQWNDGTWEHRAYWGANLLPLGVDGTVSRRYMGPLPPAGQWVRLEVPAALVGLEGSTLTGMAFALHDGRATWDYGGKASAAAPATINVALQSNGGVATASSTHSAPYVVASVNNNERAGVTWANGGGWNDGTSNQFPDWVQINFNDSKTIDRVVVYTLQDNYSNPIEPTDTLTFTQWGITAFSVQGWDGSNWVNLGTVTGNNLVKRAVSFAAFSTDRIRITVTNALGGYSRITEVEAWTAIGSGPQPTTTTLGSSLNPATAGASVTLTATVSGSAPTGSVGFTDGGSAIGGCAAVALSGSGNSRTAICNTSGLGVGTHSIVASYGGDSANAASASGALSQVISAASPQPTTTTLASSLNPANADVSVTFTATVTGNTPTGSVAFADGGNAIGGCTAVALTGAGNSRTASCSTSSLAAGSHSIVASYGGDSGNAASASGALNQVIASSGGGSATNVALQSNGGVATASSTHSAPYVVASVNNNERAGVTWANGGGWNDGTSNQFPDWVQINFNDSKTIDRVVVYTLQDNYSNPIEPTDTLTFTQWGITAFSVQGWDGSNWVNLGTVTGNNLVKRAVSFAAFSTDRIRITVTNALGGYSRITEVEAWTAIGSGPQPTTTTLGSSLNPATAGASVTLTATVSGSAPTGSVGFTDGGSAIGGCAAVALSGSGNSRTAICNTSSLAVGTHSIVARYGGDSANAASASGALSQVISAASPQPTTTTLTSSLNPATAGANVTFTATVSGSAPTGSVGFTGGGSAIGGCAAVALSGSGNSRTATCSTGSLAVGPHSVVASYGGDSANAASTSGALSQVITSAGGGGSTNVALASAGAVATASSTHSVFAVTAVNNNERAGVNWANGGGWNDATSNQYPDWVQIDFNGTKSIDRVVVYTLQDNYSNPIEPTDTLTFSQWGITAFNVQGWDGSNWINLGTVTGNNLVKRSVSFAVFTTDRIRINVANALGGHSRITEIEAWGVAAGSSPGPTTTTLTSSLNPATAGASVTLTATVSGTAPTGSVGFTDGGSAIGGCAAVALSGSGNSRTVTCSTTSLAVGTHSIVARYGGDSANAASMSVPLAQVINTATGMSTNVALASAGAFATASSVFGPGFPVWTVNNNERAGLNWSNGGGWNDATANSYPDWVQIDFNGSKTIDQVVIYTVQDNYTNPIEPEDNQTFSQYGITDFVVEAWDGSAWIALRTVTGNNLVKRSITFSPFTTSRIRVVALGGLSGYSRITEIEAYGVDAGGLTLSVALTSPLNNATYSAPASIALSADASNNNGGISRVEFYWGSFLLGTSTAAPYSLTWVNLPPGTYSLSAKAYGDTGGGFLSAPVTITVISGTGASNAPGRPTVTRNGQSIVVSWNTLPNATDYIVYATYDISPLGSIHRTYTSTSTSITVSTVDFPSLSSLYFSVAATVGGQQTPRSRWAYLVTYDQTDLGFWGAITIGDLNGDGCVEVLATFNNCAGNLAPQSEAVLGLDSLRAPGRIYRDARMADFNGDGIPDLIANVYSDYGNTNSTTLLFYGQANGTFVEATPAQFPRIYRGLGETIVVADFDSDGLLDIFLPNYTHASSQEQNYLLHNQGNGTFIEIADVAGVANRNWPGALRVEGAQALDINGDGLLDIFAASHLYINNGNMTFIDRRAEFGLPLFFDEGAKFFDWNNDGHVDLVLHDPDSGGPSLYQFNGSWFIPVNGVFPDRYYSQAYGLNVEDVDGDGYLDVLVAGGYEPNGSNKDFSLFLRRQNGYVPSHLWTATGQWSDIIGFADFDRNGTMDVILRSGNLHHLKNTASDPTTIKVFMYGNGNAMNQQGRKIRATPQSDPAFVMTRHVDGGSGYLANNEYAVTFPTPKGDWYWITADFDNGQVAGWATAGSVVRIYRNGTFTSIPQ